MKQRQTPTHVYFVGGPYSQWAGSSFKQRLEPNGERLLFNCREQYMMASKAHLFNDPQTLDLIMNCQWQAGNWNEVPRRQKQLGRAVKNYDEAKWIAERENIVFRGNWADFTQNTNMLNHMLDHVDLQIVEGAHYDRVWGVGLAYDDPRIEDERNWQGLNLLGKSIMRVRSVVLECADRNIPFSQYDEWTNSFG